MKLSRLIFLLCLLASTIILLNVWLLFSLARTRKGKYKHDIRTEFEYKINEDGYGSIYNLPLDKSGQYYIQKNFIKSKKKFSPHDVVLASHCTGDHLSHLVILSSSWQGPLSIAVLVPDYSLEVTLSSLRILYACFSNVWTQVSIHLVFPVTAIPEESDLSFHIHKSQGINPHCSTALNQISVINKNVNKNYVQKVEYPNNLLRNIAKHSLNSLYALVMDIDMRPSIHLYHNFKNFVIRNHLFEGGNSFYNDKSVFVLPAFEIDLQSTADVPEDRPQLISLFKDKKVRPFYYDKCWKCQRPTDYEKWQSLHVGQYLDVGYEIKWQDPWEPFFVSPVSAPDYDERFKQYGFNRISHACELHVAGFRYFVLDDGFLVHEGFKDNTSFHKTKNEENDKNRILFRVFKAELKEKYPWSKNRC